MWVVIEQSRENPEETWISGVFKELQDAEEYMFTDWEFYQKFQSKPLQELIEIPAKEYPVFFLVDFTTERSVYVTKEELIDMLFNLEKVEDFDDQYFMFYIIREDYRGCKPGEKQYLTYMDHCHVDNDEFKRILSLGFDAATMGLEGPFLCDYCGKKRKGTLSEKGYSPPPEWEILSNPEPDTSNEFPFLTFCSKICRLNYFSEDTIYF